jgi:hypothetical protein
MIFGWIVGRRHRPRTRPADAEFADALAAEGVAVRVGFVEPPRVFMCVLSLPDCRSWTSISCSSPVIDGHEPLISPIPLPALRRAVHIFKPLCELRRHVEHCGRKVGAVGHELAHDRQRRRLRRSHFARDVAGLKAELCAEFPRELLHAPVFGEAKHMQPLDLPVARRE